MTAALALVLAQSCAALLPARDAQLEWTLNGRSYARDVPTSSSASSRTYRRQHTRGHAEKRTLMCATVGGTSVLIETLDDEVQVRLPVQLAVGQARTVSGASVRRVQPPADGARNALWFTTTRNQVRMYAVRAGLGISEIRMQSASGAVQTYRASVRAARSGAAEAGPAERNRQRQLEDSVRALEAALRSAQTETARADSLRALAEAELATARTNASPLDERLISTLAVQVYLERGEYAEAGALLAELRRQLGEFERLTGIRHPGYKGVDELAASLARQSGRSAPRTPRAYTLAEVLRLVQGGVAPERVAEQVQRRCRAFDLAPENLRLLRTVGTTPGALDMLRDACFREGGRP